MPMLSAKTTSTITRAVVRADFQETDSSARTSTSAQTTVTIVTKTKSVQIFLAHSNVFVVLAMNELTEHIARIMTNVQKMLIIVRKTHFAQIHRAVSLARATMVIMR